MAISSQTAVPLFGALCVAEGLISEEQLELCLLLQQQKYADMPLGRILVRYGYMSEEAVARLLEIQRDLKDSHMAQAESFDRRPADLTAIILSDRPTWTLVALLEEQGGAAYVVHSWEHLLETSASVQPDMVIVEPELVPHYARPVLDLAAPIWVLPATAEDGEQPLWAREALSQFVQQFRAGLLLQISSRGPLQRETVAQMAAADRSDRRGARSWISSFAISSMAFSRS